MSVRHERKKQTATICDKTSIFEARGGGNVEVLLVIRTKKKGRDSFEIMHTGGPESMKACTLAATLGAMARNPETASEAATRIPSTWDMDVKTTQEQRNRPKRKRGHFTDVEIAPPNEGVSPADVILGRTQ